MLRSGGGLFADRLPPNVSHSTLQLRNEFFDQCSLLIAAILDH